MGTVMGSSWFIPPIKMVMNGGWCRWHCFTHMKAKTKPIPIFFTNGLYKSSRYGFHCFMKICRSCVFYPFRGCCKRGLFDFIMSISHHSRVPGTSSPCSARNSGCLHPIFNPQKRNWMKLGWKSMKKSVESWHFRPQSMESQHLLWHDPYVFR